MHRKHSTVWDTVFSILSESVVVGMLSGTVVINILLLDLVSYCVLPMLKGDGKLLFRLFEACAVMYWCVVPGTL